MGRPLWTPSTERINNANMTRFIEFINRRYNKQFTGYFELYDWSIANIAELWRPYGLPGGQGVEKVRQVVGDLN